MLAVAGLTRDKMSISALSSGGVGPACALVLGQGSQASPRRCGYSVVLGSGGACVASGVASPRGSGGSEEFLLRCLI